MQNLFAVAVIAVAMSAGMSQAQTPPAAGAQRTVKAIQPGLVEVAGPRVNDAYNAGISKIVATPGKGGKSIEVQSPYGTIFFDWPKNVKPVAFTITTGKAAGSVAEVSAPAFTEAARPDYKAAIDAVVTEAISKAADQKKRKTS